eukprot:scaffold10677_cov97-Isochrysis_galbana.AAC.1
MPTRQRSLLVQPHHAPATSSHRQLPPPPPPPMQPRLPRRACRGCAGRGFSEHGSLPSLRRPRGRLLPRCALVKSTGLSRPLAVHPSTESSGARCGRGRGAARAIQRWAWRVARSASASPCRKTRAATRRRTPCSRRR